MAWKAITVLPNVRNTSKKELMDFLQQYINPRLERIEDLGSGIDLCFGMFLLFPNSIKISEIRFGKTLSVSARHNNFKRLQSAFNAVGVEKNFPMENMMRGNFQANYYFGQWFKGFFEANYSGEPYDVNQLRQMCCNRTASKDRNTKEIRGGECKSPAETKRMPKYIKQKIAMTSPTTYSPPPPPHQASNSPPPSRLQSAVCILTKANLVDTLSQTDETHCGIINSIYSFEQEADEQKEVRSDLLREKAMLEQAVRDLQKEKEKLSTNYEHSNREKRYFYDKLREIEKLCLEEPIDSLRMSIKTVLYQQGIPL